ncbi:MFS transporter [Sinomonas sp. R1AF57]|uniref:MFS transporter n=1 Tax=Sinomonas sp. R1AF57 TaxID=2020377 RepID=UPI000B5F902A|nr:MFS transporter [Sinomonas sp. R1AF57]ASN53289.1 MFS transporter [Sinomonas sp. R1AF57]
MTPDLRARIEAAPMRTAQWLVVALATALNALDGFDVLAMAFTSARVSKDFGLTGGELGMLLSAGLVGMAIGSLVLGPIADRIGRRPVLILSVSLSAVGMLLSATAGGAWQLGLWRVVTGLGVGGILACTNVLVSEFSSKKLRGLAISIYTAGYGVGATVGGSAAVWLQATFGWHAVFVGGAAATAVLLVAVLLVAPESIDFLATRRPRGYEARLARLARRLRLGGAETADVLAVPVADATRPDPSGTTVGQLFARPNLRTTLLVWGAFFVVMFGFYFVNSWTPKLLVTAGMTESQGVVGGLMLTLGGTVGSIAYGAFAAKWHRRTVMLWFTVLAAVATGVFISTAGVLALAFVVGVLLGALINGCIAGLYVITPSAYAASLRSTGVGWAIGIGRIGAIIAPLVTGALLDTGWTPNGLYLAVGAVILIGAVAVYFLPRDASAGRAAGEPAEPEAVAAH